MRRAIVATGVGMVTPLAHDASTAWRRLLAGESAVRSAEDGLEARVPDFAPNGARSRMGDLALVAAREALRSAGLPCPAPGQRIGCAMSQSKPVLAGHERAMDPGLLLASFSGFSPEALLARELRLDGPCANVSAACATGVAALSVAAGWIREGRCDIALAGAAESSLVPLYRAGFRAMGVLADGTDPSAVRPFDARRSGFAMGEGAGAIVLESAESAARRGRRPLGRLGSAVLQHSAADAIRFDGDGTAVRRLIESAVDGAFCDHVNSHGTATALNDAAEAAGIAAAFGGRRPAVSATKAATGHLLGAAGAVEAIIALLSVRDGIAPPTLNTDAVDPAFDIDVTIGGARPGVRSALSLSYGFGGQMGAVRWDAAS